MVSRPGVCVLGQGWGWVCGLQPEFPEKNITSRVQGCRVGVSGLCCHCWHCAAEVSLCWGAGERNGTCWLLCPQRGNATSRMHLGSGNRLSECIPWDPLHCLPLRYLSTSTGAMHCFTSLHICHAVDLTPVFEHLGCINLWKSALLIFLVNGFGEVFSFCDSLCAPLFLLPLWPGFFPPSVAPMICYSPKSCLCTSTFHEVASSLPIVVQFVLSVLR